MDKTVGVLGGGQLGRMLTEAANRLNIKVITLDAKGCPASQVSAGNLIEGNFKDPQAIAKLANQVDVVTIEIEHVDTDALRDLSENAKVNIQPHWQTIRTIQDKFDQKEYLLKRGIPVARSVAVKKGGDVEDVLKAVRSVGGCPVFLKARKDAYDGRGNFALKSESEIPEAIKALGHRDLYVEEWAAFRMELAVMIVKTEETPDADWRTGTLAFPIVETVHEDSICKLCFLSPRKVKEEILHKSQEFARKAVAGFGGKGIFGVEMFLLQNGDILINEIAPRPHNSGHLTIEACAMSQYEATLRALLDLPIDPASLEADRAAIMLNILGAGTPTGHLEVRSEAAKIPRASIHMYGKGDGRPGRKMGHVTVTAKTLVEAEERVLPLIDLVDRLRAERLVPKTSSSTKHEPSSNKTAVSTNANPTVAGPVQIAITMGSDSDRKVAEPGAALLRKFGINFEANITSAHRTPERMVQYAREAASRGIKVLICLAGGAAHLPGMVAACTQLPVIGVPVRATHLDGIDSLLSIVQMPKGCPVATVGVNNSENAAQLAIRILATSDPEIKQKLDKFLQDQTDEVTEKGKRMQQLGIEDYTWPPAPQESVI